MELASPQERIKFKGFQPYEISKGDSIYKSDKRNKITLDYSRDKKTLTTIVRVDSLEKQVKFEPQNTTDYYLDRILFLGLPTNYHKNHKKRFKYANKFWITSNEDSINVSRHKIYNSGDVSLNLSLPYVNYFSYKFDGIERFDTTGFLGVGLALQFYIDQKHSIEAGAAFKLNYPIPILFPVFDDYDYLSVSSLSLRYHYLATKWDYSAGVTFDYVLLSREIEDRPNPPDQKANNLGLYLSSKYRIGGNAFVGIEYNPTFINLNNGGNSGLNHNLSFGIEWRFRVRRTQ